MKNEMKFFALIAGMALITSCQSGKSVSGRSYEDDEAYLKSGEKFITDPVYNPQLDTSLATVSDDYYNPNSSVGNTDKSISGGYNTNGGYNNFDPMYNPYSNWNSNLGYSMGYGLGYSSLYGCGSGMYGYSPYGMNYGYGNSYYGYGCGPYGYGSIYGSSMYGYSPYYGYSTGYSYGNGFGSYYHPYGYYGNGYAGSTTSSDNSSRPHTYGHRPSSGAVSGINSSIYPNITPRPRSGMSTHTASNPVVSPDRSEGVFVNGHRYETPTASSHATNSNPRGASPANHSSNVHTEKRSSALGDFIKSAGGGSSSHPAGNGGRSNTGGSWNSGGERTISHGDSGSRNTGGSYGGSTGGSSGGGRSSGGGSTGGGGTHRK